MVRSKKTIIMSLALAIVIIMGVFTSSSYAMASETRDSNLANVTEESSGSEIVPFVGTETLKIGDCYIGKFTFKNTNLTHLKTMPSGAKNYILRLCLRRLLQMLELVE